MTSKDYPIKYPSQHTEKSKEDDIISEALGAENTNKDNSGNDNSLKVSLNEHLVNISEMTDKRTNTGIESRGGEQSDGETESEVEFPLYLEEFKNEIIRKVMKSEKNLAKDILEETDLVEQLCRICYDDGEDPDNPLVKICRCKGSVGLVHFTCLQRWLNEKSTNKCELCQYRFKTKFVASQKSILKSMLKYTTLTDASRGFQAPNFLMTALQAMVVVACFTIFNLFVLNVSMNIVITNPSLAFKNYLPNVLIICFALLITWIFSYLFSQDLFLHYWIWYRWWLRSFSVELCQTGEVPNEVTDTEFIPSTSANE